MQPILVHSSSQDPAHKAPEAVERILLCIFWLHKSFPNLMRQNKTEFDPFNAFHPPPQNMLSARRYFSFNFVTLDDLRHADDLPIDLKAQYYDKIYFCVLQICSSLIHLFNWLWWFHYSLFFSHFFTLLVIRCCHIERFIIFSRSSLIYFYCIIKLLHDTDDTRVKSFQDYTCLFWLAMTRFNHHRK